MMPRQIVRAAERQQDTAARPLVRPASPDRERPAAGQAMVLMALLLALLLLPLGLTILEVRAQTDTYRQVQQVVTTAAYDAAGMLDPHALLAGKLTVDRSAAQQRADRTLRQGLTGYGQRVAAGQTVLTVRPGSPPILCYAADVTIGVVVRDGWGWTYHLSACARSAVPAS